MTKVQKTYKSTDIEEESVIILKKLLSKFFRESTEDLGFAELVTGDRTPTTDGFIRYKDTDIPVQIKGTVNKHQSHSVRKQYLEYAMSNTLLYFYITNVFEEFKIFATILSVEYSGYLSQGSVKFSKLDTYEVDELTIGELLEKAYIKIASDKIYDKRMLSIQTDEHKIALVNPDQLTFDLDEITVDASGVLYSEVLSNVDVVMETRFSDKKYYSGNISKSVDKITILKEKDGEFIFEGVKYYVYILPNDEVLFKFLEFTMKVRLGDLTEMNFSFGQLNKWELEQTQKLSNFLETKLLFPRNEETSEFWSLLSNLEKCLSFIKENSIDFLIRKINFEVIVKLWEYCNTVVLEENHPVIYVVNIIHKEKKYKFLVMKNREKHPQLITNNMLARIETESNCVAGNISLLFTRQVPLDFLLCNNIKYSDVIKDSRVVFENNTEFQSQLLQNLVKKIIFDSSENSQEIKDLLFNDWIFLRESANIAVRYNYLQAKFVSNIKFTVEDEEFLSDLTLNDSYKFYGHVLLENKNFAKKEFDRLPEEVQKRIENEAVYLIYEKICLS